MGAKGTVIGSEGEAAAEQLQIVQGSDAADQLQVQGGGVADQLVGADAAACGGAAASGQLLQLSSSMASVQLREDV